MWEKIKNALSWIKKNILLCIGSVFVSALFGIIGKSILHNRNTAYRVGEKLEDAEGTNKHLRERINNSEDAIRNGIEGFERIETASGEIKQTIRRNEEIIEEIRNNQKL